jgi:hypothetical protein
MPATTELRVAEGRAPADWDEGIASSAGTVFHTTAWAGYVAATQKGVLPIFTRFDAEDGSPQALALGFRMRSRPRLGFRLRQSLWLDSLPTLLGHDSSILPAFLRALVHYSVSAGDIDLRISSYASRNSSLALDHCGFSLKQRVEFLLPLDRPEDERWKALPSKRRNDIQRALRKGVQVRQLTGEDGITELRRLLAVTRTRIIRRGGQVNPLTLSSTDPIHSLLRAGIARVFGAFLEGECVSAALLTEFGGLAYYTLAGHNETGLRVQAPTLLLWQAMNDCARDGCSYFNLGGSHIPVPRSESGVYKYKASFGAEKIKCASGYKILRPGRAMLARAVLRATRRG